jgi:hypothetical protein
MNYLVVLFKNKSKKKIINKFITLERAKNFFDKKIAKNNQIYFEKKIENATPCDFELCILKKKDNKFDSLYIKDDLGRQVKVELDDPEYNIMRVSKYRIEEKIHDVLKNEKISIETFFKKYILKKGIVLVSKLNNKVVVQNDDKVFLFSLKNEDESKRFLDVLSKFLIEKSSTNCIIVSESSKTQKKYLYEILNNLGIDKNILYRKTTTFKPR